MPFSVNPTEDSEIVEQFTIWSPSDIAKLDIVDTTRMGMLGKYTDVNSYNYFDLMYKYLYGCGVAKVHVDGLRKYHGSGPQFPGWKHVGNHERTGLRLWHYWHAAYGEDLEALNFVDSPDFNMRITHPAKQWGFEPEVIKIVGDVGKVSATTFLESQIHGCGFTDDFWVTARHSGAELIWIQRTWDAGLGMVRTAPETLDDWKELYRYRYQPENPYWDIEEVIEAVEKQYAKQEAKVEERQ